MEPVSSSSAAREAWEEEATDCNGYVLIIFDDFSNPCALVAVKRALRLPKMLTPCSAVLETLSSSASAAARRAKNQAVAFPSCERGV